jgi:hypothetical protein
MQIKKTTGTALLIAVIAIHISARLMARDAFVVSAADYAHVTNDAFTPAMVTLISSDFQNGTLLHSGNGFSANPNQHPIPY